MQIKMMRERNKRQLLGNLKDSAELEKSVHNFIPCTINVQGSPLDEQIVWHTVVSEIENDINYKHVFVETRQVRRRVI